MQAFGGLVETGIGGGMTLWSLGVAAPIGVPVMAHGLDHFFTGMGTAITGRPRETATSQLLQKTGMSPQTAGLVDNGLGIVGSMGGTAAVRTATVFMNEFRAARAIEIFTNELRVVKIIGKEVHYVPKSLSGNPLPLPRNMHGVNISSVEVPHTQLGWRPGSNGGYRQTRQWGYNGNEIKTTDWTDHGMPSF